MADLAGTGLPIIDWGEIFHVGVRVPDLEKAQRELTKMTGVHWTTPARLRDSRELFERWYAGGTLF